MPIRTSAVVSAGIVLLALVGVATIFGNSIVAMVAPPRIEGTVAPEPKKAASPAPVAVPAPASGTAADAG